MFLNIFLQDFLGLLRLFLLHLLALKLEQFSLFVPLGESQFLCFIFELHEFTRMRRFLTSFRPKPFMKLLNLQLMLLLEFLET